MRLRPAVLVTVVALISSLAVPTSADHTPRSLNKDGTPSALWQAGPGVAADAGFPIEVAWTASYQALPEHSASGCAT